MDHRSRSALALVCVIFAGARCATAVNVGDENFTNDPVGSFYVFADSTIHVIDPLNQVISANITRDQYGTGLNFTADGKNVSKLWNDAVYVQKTAQSSKLVMVNEGDVYTEGSSSFSYVTILDTTTQRIAGRVRVGARPVHIYAINATSKAWTHSDAEGVFYVISSDNVGGFNFDVKPIPSFVLRGGHGKLLVNDALYPVGYGTNTAEAWVSKFDLSNDTRTSTILLNATLTNASSCPGTHSIVYSRVNKHVYFECTSDGGIVEWNSVTDKLVAQHPVNGALSTPPADDRVFVVSSSNSSATILIPGANGSPSTVDKVISVPSQPGTPVFWANATNSVPLNYTSYTAYFPLARNTNLNNIRAAGDLVVSAGYASRPTDCQYSTEPIVSTSSVSTVASGLRLASSGGSPTTPTCGACAAGINTTDASQFNASLAGFGIYDLNSTASNTTLLPAGALLPVRSLATTANECSFSSLTRYAKKGGNCIVTVADLPFPSLQVNYIHRRSPASTMAFNGVGSVATAPNPRRAVWVPNAINSAFSG